MTPGRLDFEVEVKGAAAHLMQPLATKPDASRQMGVSMLLLIFFQLQELARPPQRIVTTILPIS